MSWGGGLFTVIKRLALPVHLPAALISLVGHLHAVEQAKNLDVILLDKVDMAEAIAKICI